MHYPSARSSAPGSVASSQYWEEVVRMSILALIYERGSKNSEGYIYIYRVYVYMYVHIWYKSSSS